MERSRKKSLTLLAAAIGALLVTVAGLNLKGTPAVTAGQLIPGELYDFQVEVLNGTSISGLARDATALLRRHGLDVVSYGTAAGEERDSTRVIIRRSGDSAALLIRNVLGVGGIVTDLDSSLYVDVTVLLGKDAAAVVRHP